MAQPGTPTAAPAPPDGAAGDPGTLGAPGAPAITACWAALRLLAERLRACEQPVASCWLSIGERPEIVVDAAAPPAGLGWKVLLLLDGAAAASRPPPAPGESRYLVEDLVSLRPLALGGLPAAAAALVETYAPYCLAAAYARRAGRAFAVSHFAQSLDGRIATPCGDSKWIGCPENLVHAHRMRALCDGVLVGARTLRADRPALTVRHVAGEDPVRIVLGYAAPGDLECLLEAGPGRVLVIGDGDRDGGGVPPPSPRVERLALPRRNGRLSTAAVLEALFRRGIHSVYVEGGSTTTSAFLADGTIDVLQLHIAPLILGAGIPSFRRAEVPSVGASVRFSTHLYRPVGDGILFVGRVA